MKKSELYTNERQIILEKILEILNISEENNTFFLHDIDSDDKKKIYYATGGDLEKDRFCFLYVVIGLVFSAQM